MRIINYNYNCKINHSLLFLNVFERWEDINVDLLLSEKSLTKDIIPEFITQMVYILLLWEEFHFSNIFQICNLNEMVKQNILVDRDSKPTVKRKVL